MAKCCDHDHSEENTTPPVKKSGSRPAISFRVFGLDCAEEIQILRKEIGPIVGGADKLSFDLLNAKMSIHGEGIVANRIIAAVTRTGMKAEIWGSKKLADKKSFLETHSRNLMTTLSGLLVFLGFIYHVRVFGFASAMGANELAEGHTLSFVSQVFYGLAVLSGTYFVLPKAILAARKFRPDMNLLMLIAVIGALFIGEWFEAASVAFLFSLSLTLEAWSIGRARKAVAALLELAPPVARILDDDGNEKLVPPDSIAVGSVFVVKPGDRFPLDGKIIKGQSDVNQSPVTGESIPVAKKEGDEVFAGTINGDGALHIASTKSANDTTLASIIRMVGDAQSTRAPSEQFVEKFAVIYTPIVIFLALAVLIIPPLFFAGLWNEWIYRSLVLLVIACPCALVISTPVSIVAALACAARHGVLIKGGAFIEVPAKLKAIAIDKTGTLTLGKPTIIEVVPAVGVSKEDFLTLAAALELNSSHPIATAITEYSKQNQIPMIQIDDYQIIPGKGAQGKIHGEDYWLGSHRFLEETNFETKDLHDEIVAKEMLGHTIVVVGSRHKIWGYIALKDAVRPDAKEMIKQLHREGVTSVVMLTGDNEQTAKNIALEVGIDKFFAQLLPMDKVREIDNLVKKYGSVAMIGDGVNDAPAMGRASIAIAMGAIGSDVAIETADIALMSDDLSKIAWLIKHSKNTIAVIRQNIYFSLSIKAIFVILTFFGYSSLWMAIIADMGTSLLVVFNALRLLRN